MTPGTTRRLSRGSPSTNVLRLTIVLVLCRSLAACVDPTGEPAPERPGSAALAGVELALPADFRMVDRASVRALVVINGETFPLDDGGAGPATLTRTYPAGTRLSVTADWRRRVDDLVVWRASRVRVVGSGDLSIRFRPDDYVSAGDAAVFDIDADGWSNLQELDCAADPTSPASVCDTSTPSSPVTVPSDVRVIIARMPAGTPAPTLDGRIEEPGGDPDGGPWRFATSRDVDDEDLSIANLMLRPDAGPLRSNPAYRWRAMHDGDTLYVHVFGKRIEDPVHADSENAFHDDSMAIFLDGDASGDNLYDGVDDYSTYLPLESRSGVPNSDAGRVQPGLNSASLGVPSGLRFEVCACETEYSWEVAVPLDSFGAAAGDVIGLEVQIDEDNDGDNRDARFGWSNPSLFDEGIGSTDFAWRDPSYFARVFLQP